MKKVQLFLIVISISFGLQAGAKDLKEVSILFIGDSLAHGSYGGAVEVERKKDGVFATTNIFYAMDNGYSLIQRKTLMPLLERGLRLLQSNYQRKKLDIRQPDILVIQVGANEFGMAPGTGAAYIGDAAAEVQKVLNSGKARTQIFWVGLPIVRDHKRNEFQKNTNALTQASVEKLGIHFVDIYAATSVNGDYSPFLNGRRFRDQDGIHFSGEGYSLVWLHIRKHILQSLN